MPPIRTDLVNWPNGPFLVSTLLLALTEVPLYVASHGLDGFQVVLFLVFFIATGLSITLGYHRLFAYLTFKTPGPVRLLTLICGAAAFENSVLRWAADHRKHHNDPTKWCICLLRTVGLVCQLRRVPDETTLEAPRDTMVELRREFREAKKRLHAAIRDWQEAYRTMEAQLA